MSNTTRPECPPGVPAPKGQSREIWLGVFVIAGVLAIFAALFTLTDASTFRGRYTITTFVDDAAGIRRGDSVQYRGVNIGRVKGFHISPRGVAIQLEIEDEFKIPRDSRVVLSSNGLLGNVIAEVTPGRSEQPVLPGSTLPGSVGEQLGEVAGHVAERTGRVLERVEAMLSDRTVKSVEDSTVELSELLDELSATTAEQRAALARLSASLGRSAANVEVATGPALLRSVARVDTITQRLGEMTPRIEGALGSLDRSSRAAESVLARIERGEGTLGRITSDDTLYLDAARTIISANKAVTQLGLLAEDVRRNPKRYLNLSLF